MQLAAMQPGESAIIAGFSGDGASRRKLLSLGFVRGSSIEIVRKQAGTGMCVRVGTSLYMLNAVLAEMIIVEKAS